MRSSSTFAPFEDVPFDSVSMTEPDGTLWGTGREPAMQRAMSVPGYVEARLEDVLDAFADRSTIVALLDEATAKSFSAALAAEVRSATPEPIAARSARVKLLWRYTDPRAGDRSGDADLQLLTVQSGNDPLTELLVTISVDSSAAPAFAPAIHRFVDELADLLARRPTDASPPRRGGSVT